MRVIDRLLPILLAASAGCAADAYQLGALSDDGSGDGSGGSGSTADGASSSGGAEVDPLQGASPIKAIQDTGMVEVTGGLWSPDDGWMLVADAGADAVARVDLAGVTSVVPDVADVRGLAFDADGTLLVARAGEVLRVPSDGEPLSLAAEVDGVPLQTPHAIAVDDEGRRYVTDPPAGTVVRIDPDGTVGEAASGLQQPHGLVFDPDHARLLVAERDDARIVALSVAADGSLSDPVPFAVTGAPVQGLCVDDHANVYAAGDAGLDVFAPDGDAWGSVASPDPLTDCSFGRSGPGILLYLTSSTVVYGIDLLVDGPP